MRATLAHVATHAHAVLLYSIMYTQCMRYCRADLCPSEPLIMPLYNLLQEESTLPEPWSPSCTLYNRFRCLFPSQALLKTMVIITLGNYYQAECCLILYPDHLSQGFKGWNTISGKLLKSTQQGPAKVASCPVKMSLDMGN